MAVEITTLFFSAKKYKGFRVRSGDPDLQSVQRKIVEVNNVLIYSEQGYGVSSFEWVSVVKQIELFWVCVCVCVKFM